MARMIPALPKEFHGSEGEKRVFRALRTLPDDVVVIHSFRWLHPGNAKSLSGNLGAQGEGDFVLVDPSRGILVVEVKGGDIWCEEGEWFQRNRKTGRSFAINPEAQASNTMFRIRLEVTNKLPNARDVLFCHAVWFPDGTVDRHNLPMNYHSNMTLDGESITEPERAIQRAFDYWRSLHPTRVGLGQQANSILKVLTPTFSIVPSIRQKIDEREEQLIQLNREQAKVLDFLDEQYHAAIHGAAGTGKTLLAVEKARRLASPTEPVLFLCYNSALCDHLNDHHSNPNVSYRTFHGFARELTGPDGTPDEQATRLLEHLADNRQLPYHHLVVDEGQDFDCEWLEYLGIRFRDSAFYVFYDKYQAIQRQKDTTWIDEIPCRLVLTRNCRNTDPIAKAAYRAADLPVSPTLGIDGPPPRLHVVDDDTAAIAVVNKLISEACGEHKIAAEEIAVLSLATINEESPWRLPKLGGRHVSNNPRSGHVTVTTVRRFKGLEASLVLIVDADFTKADDPLWRLLLYVACSRARHAVHIITTTKESEIGDAVRALADTEKARPKWQTLCRILGVRRGGHPDAPFD